MLDYKRLIMMLNMVQRLISLEVFFIQDNHYGLGACIFNSHGSILQIVLVNNLYTCTLSKGAYRLK